MEILGIDIGGTGIKGAPVSCDRGELLAERFRIETPKPATPAAVAQVVGELVEKFHWSGPIGCTFPAVVQHGVTMTASNVDPSWIGADAAGILGKIVGRPMTVINDADAAGLAEVQFGAGRGRRGVVLMVTLGTGIGSALFLDGRLVPNSEFGHIEVRGKDAERRAAYSVRERKKLSWKSWGKRVGEYLGKLESLVNPDLIIIGGGVSRKHDKFFEYIETRCEVLPAKLFNDAGIVGAALAAQPCGGAGAECKVEGDRANDEALHFCVASR